MNTDDIVYVLCLLSCIWLGSFYRNVKDFSQRKILGTSFGLLIVFIVSGFHTLHCLISFGLCSLAITRCHPSKCHLYSFGIMFGYLAFFRTAHYFGIPSVPGHTNMIQMILTLKVAGVAFEKNASYNKINQRDKELAEKEKNPTVPIEHTEITEYDVQLQTISTTELFHYSFNYIGILTGPYYRYRTYRDYFETPFKDYAKPFENTLEKLKYCAFYCVMYLACNYFWPISYALEPEFYEERSWIYRTLYVWPTFFIFRMRIYTGLTLSESVCTNAGFGAYPNDSNVAHGEGPTGQYLHLKRNANEKDYNYKTIQNIDVYNTETCWTFREAMKHWNICVQYWLAVNVYKRFPSKKYRTGVTLLVSAFWHGFMPGHYFCIMGAPFYVPVEDMLNKAIRKEAVGLKRKIIDVLFWIHKFFAFSYLGIAFLLLTFEKIWAYYGSIYHFGYVYYFGMMVVAVILLKHKRATEKRKQKAQKIAETATTENVAVSDKPKIG